jgi:hypothetical protein
MRKIANKNSRTIILDSSSRELIIDAIIRLRPKRYSNFKKNREFRYDATRIDIYCRINFRVFPFVDIAEMFLHVWYSPRRVSEGGYACVYVREVGPRHESARRKSKMRLCPSRPIHTECSTGATPVVSFHRKLTRRWSNRKI